MPEYFWKVHLGDLGSLAPRWGDDQVCRRLVQSLLHSLLDGKNGAQHIERKPILVGDDLASAHIEFGAARGAVDLLLESVKMSRRALFIDVEDDG